MSNVEMIDKFLAYGMRPDIFDAPTPLQCVAIASELKRLSVISGRADELAEALEMWRDRLKGPSKIDLQAMLHLTDAALANHREAEA